MEIIRRNTCRVCAYCHKSGGGKYYCRLYPPTPLFVAFMTPQGPKEDIMTLFPEVKPDMWCGQFNAVAVGRELGEEDNGMGLGRGN